MISPQQVYLLGVTKLQHQNEAHHFYTKLSAVHIISEEEILLGLCTSESLENIEQIKVLTMDVSHDYDW